MMEDALIVEQLWNRSESALHELQAKYGRVLRHISYNVLRNSDDAEECVNDAYLSVWNAIPPKKPNSLYAFVCRIIRNISLTRYHYLRAEKRNVYVTVCLDEISDFITDEDQFTHEIERMQLTKLLEDWLWSLNEENRYIFIRRYWYMDEVETIAEKLSLSKASVYLRIDRMKKKLKAYLKRMEVLS